MFIYNNQAYHTPFDRKMQGENRPSSVVVYLIFYGILRKFKWAEPLNMDV